MREQGCAGKILNESDEINAAREASKVPKHN